MIGVVEAALALGTEVMKHINTKQARKYVDEIHDIKQEILAEESKGYHSDDAKIEGLYGKLQITLEAAKDEFILASTKS